MKVRTGLTRGLPVLVAIAIAVTAGCGSERGATQVPGSGRSGTAPRVSTHGFSPVADSNGDLVTRDGKIVLMSAGSPAVNTIPAPPDVTLPNGQVVKGAASARAADQVDSALATGHAKLVARSDPSLDVYCTHHALVTRTCGIGSSQQGRP